jgi:hypothetical protein
MNPLTFLGIALVVAVVGTVLVLLLNRPRTDAAMEEFQREMQALAPRQDPPQRSARRTGPMTADDQDHGTPADPAMDES